MPQTSFVDAVNGLVDIDTDDEYEGTGTNDKLLGRMYYLNQYAKAAKEEYDKCRSELDTSSLTDEKAVFLNDGKFSATGQTTRGRKSLDRTLLLGRLTDLLYKLDCAGSPDKTGSRIKAQIAADQLLDDCTSVGKESTTVSVIKNA